MIRIILLLTPFFFLMDITVAFLILDLPLLRNLVTKLEKDYKELGLDAIGDNMKHAWAEAMKDGHGQLPDEMNHLHEFIEKVAKDFNQAVENVYKDFGEAWKHYATVFGKEYAPEEKKMRNGIFRKNLKRMKKHNSLFKQGKVAYNANLNQLSDRTEKELEKMKGYRLSNDSFHGYQQSNSDYYQHSYGSRVPSSVDWRKKGHVTSVKNQGQCGSCYAFAGVGALEAYHKKKTGRLIDLSEQNIIDCTWDLGNNGCNGGNLFQVFQYAQKKGVVSYKKYPYKMRASRNCRWQKNHVVTKDKGYRAVARGNEEALKHAVANHGPVVVGIGTGGNFNSYSSGIFYSRGCGRPNHAVLVVGYGTDPRHGEYWIIKNSWGTFWGERGYMRMARNKHNTCDIASNPVFPI